MIFYIVGRLTYFISKFDPLEEGILEYDTNQGAILKTIKLMEALLDTQDKISKGIIKLSEMGKYGQHMDTYKELQQQ